MNEDFEINEMYLGLDVGLGPAVLLQPLHLEENKVKYASQIAFTVLPGSRSQSDQCCKQ